MAKKVSEKAAMDLVPSSKGIITERQRQQHELTGKLWNNADKIFEALMDVALGHYCYMKVEIAGGTVEKVYLEPPDGPRLQYVMDRLLGKPKETVELVQVASDEMIMALGRVLARHVDRPKAFEILQDFQRELGPEATNSGGS